MVDGAKELTLPSYIFLTSDVGFEGFVLYLLIHEDRISTVFEFSDHELLIPSTINPVPACVLLSPLFNRDVGHATFLKLPQRFKDVNGIIINTFPELEPYAVLVI
ncbi:hypothetical protein CUMW_032430 [Citrus unshiu]|nr:hypothetical protein CUMW_032430 [Citrus unshiu]